MGTGPQVVVLYANAGSLGHEVLARNYAQLLGRNGYAVRCEDVLKLDGGALSGALSSLYAKTLEQAPWLWRYLYSSWDRLPGVESLRLGLMARRFPNTARMLLKCQPEIIVTTHPLATAVASRLKVRNGLASRLVTITGDWHLQRFWLFPGVDLYIASTARQRDTMAALGVDRDRIVVAGLLAGAEYRQGLGKQEARARLGLPQDRAVILLTGGGRGWQLERTVRGLARLAMPAVVVIFCGGDERRQRMERWLKSSAPQVEFRLPMFEMDPSLYFFAGDLLVSKPGGMSTVQAFITGLPFLPLSPMPGHEEENLKELERAGAVLRAGDGLTLCEQIEQALGDQRLLEETTRRARRLVDFDIESLVIGALAGKVERS